MIESQGSDLKQEPGGRSWGAKQGWWMNAPDFLDLYGMLSLLCHTAHIISSKALKPTVGWALQYQTLIKKIPKDAKMSRWWKYFLSWSSLSQVCWSLYEADEKLIIKITLCLFVFNYGIKLLPQESLSWV